MASPLASTNGVWLYAVFLQALLHGMGLLQGFLYFVWYPKDGWSIKSTVIIILVVESVQMAAAFSNASVWFIDGFGEFENLNIVHPQDMVQLTALYLSTFVAQVHFARTIYQWHRESVILPVLVFVTSLVALGGGMAQVGLTIQAKEYSKLGQLSPATSYLQASFSLAADIVITFGLCWRLNKSRTGIQSTNHVLNFLIMTAINRGAFTMLFAALNMILFIRKPRTFYFMLALMISDKLYLNSMLAMLNTRQHAVRRSGTRVSEQQVSMRTFSSNARNVPTGVILHTTTEIFLDNMSHPDDTDTKHVV
ncbi:hypothetical protein DFH09DRAFT_328532 [Mycena vulgaris]|nr:hypothetical protein DFH09DRAFT_1290210 [Mycena vulgaris]KAJ6499838.1 hypothetical protein DFH09DRAFT_328532 [Mycena vulgaris]